MAVSGRECPISIKTDRKIQNIKNNPIVTFSRQKRLDGQKHSDIKHKLVSRKTGFSLFQRWRIWAFFEPIFKDIELKMTTIVQNT